MRRRCDTATRQNQPLSLAQWRARLMTRRRFLLGLTGGSMAALFGLRTSADEPGPPAALDTWKLLDAVQQLLLPSEPDSPGAREIRALDYLRFVVADPRVDEEERAFITKGAGWLNGIAREKTGRPFLELDDDAREQVMRQVALSPAGENWLSTLLLYIMEALLTDPVYGGNPDGIGWRWLQHTPGYPRPPSTKTYPRLLS
jgi:gluconate 2-dehydrogenase gamma chain